MRKCVSMWTLKRGRKQNPRARLEQHPACRKHDLWRASRVPPADLSHVLLHHVMHDLVQRLPPNALVFCYLNGNLDGGANHQTSHSAQPAAHDGISTLIYGGPEVSSLVDSETGVTVPVVS